MSIEVFTPKQSSVIKHYAWDSSFNTLAIMFHSGSVWTYHNISDKCYKEFKESSSLGAYFNKNIRDVYQATKVGNIYDPSFLSRGSSVGQEK